MKRLIRISLFSFVSLTTAIALITRHIVTYRNHNRSCYEAVMKLYGRGILLDFAPSSNGLYDRIFQIRGIPDFHYCTLIKLGRDDVFETRITDAEILSILPCIHASRYGVKLDISSTEATDAVMPLIARFRTIHKLNLTGSKVSSSSLSELKQMKQLIWLSLNHANFSDDDLRALQISLPRCHIEVAARTAISQNPLSPPERRWITTSDLMKQIDIIP